MTTTKESCTQIEGKGKKNSIMATTRKAMPNQIIKNE
jgi:hypothetical protein